MRPEGTYFPFGRQALCCEDSQRVPEMGTVCLLGLGQHTLPTPRTVPPRDKGGKSPSKQEERPGDGNTLIFVVVRRLNLGQPHFRMISPPRKSISRQGECCEC